MFQQTKYRTIRELSVSQEDLFRLVRITRHAVIIIIKTERNPSKCDTILALGLATRVVEWTRLV